MVNSKDIESVDSECNIYYKDGSEAPCPYLPTHWLIDCEIGYGPNRGCPKYDYYHNLIGGKGE